MSTIIPADDLRPGLFVAAHTHGECEPHFQISHSDTIVQVTREDCVRPGLGVPMRIIAVDLPFIYCMIIEPGGSEGGPLIVDVRTLSLMRVSRTTIRALAKVRV